MLRRYVQAAAEQQGERCDLCGEIIPPEHRHLLEVAERNILCVCHACSILFDRKAASDGKLRLIPDRRLRLDDFAMSDAQWDSFQIPVGIAFFCYSTPAGRQVAFYPSPAGPVESLLPLGTWDELAAANPALTTLEPDVEALLINRARGARHAFVAPIDECYRLVGLIRLQWRGLGGGSAVWDEIDRFFEELSRRSKSLTKGAI